MAAARTPSSGHRQKPQKGEADNGYRDYYATDGVQCSEALRAALGREGYISWLRGTILKYLWRLGAKPGIDPVEDVTKVDWYVQELKRVLADPTA
jgi:hypothetical protein